MRLLSCQEDICCELDTEKWDYQCMIARMPQQVASSGDFVVPFSQNDISPLSSLSAPSFLIFGWLEFLHV